MCSFQRQAAVRLTRSFRGRVSAHRQQTGSESAAYVNIGHGLARVKNLLCSFFTLLRALIARPSQPLREHPPVTDWNYGCGNGGWSQGSESTGRTACALKNSQFCDARRKRASCQKCRFFLPPATTEDHYGGTVRPVHEEKIRQQAFELLSSRGEFYDPRDLGSTRVRGVEGVRQWKPDSSVGEPPSE